MGNFTVSALPHGEGPRHRQGTGLLVNTPQYRAPVSRSPPAWGAVGEAWYYRGWALCLPLPSFQENWLD